MEILVLLGYTAILSLVAPFVMPKSDFYGRFVPAGIAAVSGSALWLIFTWLGFHYDEAWIWFVVMLGMPAAIWFATGFLNSRRSSAEAKELEQLRATR
ncbi:hypothetical protein [Candidatus Aquiluna sp. UB-MaderosW2red]|jgi:hypothetical protein|uniref:hypothetical protein n=1 Tax=Candidatus Aquiluna sp. UB-MaderosW2red TaxID=1855377 RepID=UPI000875C703|nr:hypothetical protein [Candidatus Aquiluna sp. UB-MaderosW2red]SCX14068.1 hypothetical protein SAMN05216534_1477 [Candidatus Aquiluna sp. UB-MaderosW2red]